MSTAYAIAEVSSVLKSLLGQGLEEHGVKNLGVTVDDVSVLPPDQVDAGSRLNVYLYQVTPNLGWRNECLPSRNVRSERITNQPLAIDLHYLVSAHGDVELFTDLLLGSAMQTLHEKPFFDRSAVRDFLLSGAANPFLQALGDASITDQLEQITITPEYLSNEDMSKLWSAFQSSYRQSATYVVTVVLIEAEKPSVSALPVLTRGITARPSLIPPTPTLMAIEYPAQQISARLGETIVITGFNLNGTNVRAKLQMLSVEQVDNFPLLPNANNERVEFVLPTDVAVWRAGVYQLSLTMDNDDGDLIESNQLTITIAPSFSGFTTSRNPDNTIDVEITIKPEVTETQSIIMIIGQIQKVAKKIAFPPGIKSVDKVQFKFSDIPDGEYWARVRVDGIDSILINRAGPEPKFHLDHKVVVPS